MRRPACRALDGFEVKTKTTPVAASTPPATKPTVENVRIGPPTVMLPTLDAGTSDGAPDAGMNE